MKGEWGARGGKTAKKREGETTERQDGDRDTHRDKLTETRKQRKLKETNPDIHDQIKMNLTDNRLKIVFSNYWKRQNLAAKNYCPGPKQDRKNPKKPPDRPRRKKRRPNFFGREPPNLIIRLRATRELGTSDKKPRLPKNTK